MKTIFQTQILRELLKYCEVLFYSVKRSSDAAAGIYGFNFICRSQAAAADTDPNISVRHPWGMYVDIIQYYKQDNTKIWYKHYLLLNASTNEKTCNSYNSTQLP